MVFVENDSFRNLPRLPTDAFRSVARLPDTLPVAASDLVAWYPFRQGTGEDITAGDSRFDDPTDYSAVVNGATYRPSGGTTDIQTGANSGAFEFDGVDDSLSGPSDILPTGDNDITVTAFINLRSINDATIFSAGETATAKKFVFRTETVNDSQVLRYENEGGNFVSTLPVPIGQFSFVSVVYQTGGNLEFQVGTQTDTGTIQQNNISAVEPFRIGRSPRSRFQFDGIIDGVRVYSTALSKNQRDQIRQNIKP